MPVWAEAAAQEEEALVLAEAAAQVEEGAALGGIRKVREESEWQEDRSREPPK